MLHSQVNKVLISGKKSKCHSEPEREVSGVPSGVPDEFVAIAEGFVAELARVPLVVALVDAKVLRQVLALGEGLLADVATVRSDPVRLRTHDDCLAGVERDRRDHRAVVQIRLQVLLLK